MAASDLVVEGIHKRYGGTVVLQSLSLCVAAGEAVAIVGPSGSGKSTLLNIVGSLDKPNAGTVRLGDLDVGALSGDALYRYRAEEVGFVFQEHHLLPQLTAIENVLLPTLALRHRPGAAEGLAHSLLERVGVARRADAFPAHMSGGERQRVALARALINRPLLLLCDEPTGNLDADSGAAVVDMLLDLARTDGVTVLMVTHNPQHAARFDRRYEMRVGALAEAAPHA